MPSSFFGDNNTTYTTTDPGGTTGPETPNPNPPSPSSYFGATGGIYAAIQLADTSLQQVANNAAAAAASATAASSSASSASTSAANAASAATTAANAVRASIAIALSSTAAGLVVGGSPAAYNGTLSLSWGSQAVHTVLAGPSGGSGVPTWRQLGASDISGLTAFATLATGTSAQYVRGDGVLATTPVGSVTSVAMTVPTGLAIGGSPITSSGTLALSWSGTIPATSLPNPSATTLGGVQSLAAVASKWINTISTSGVPSATQPAFTDISGSVSAAQMPALTGDVTTTAGTVATTIAAGAVTFAKVASAAIASTAQYLSNTASELLSTDKVWGAAAPVTVTYGATVTLDFSTFVNAAMTFGAGNVTFANPSNVKAGQVGIIALTQDGTGSRTASWGANFHFPGGTAPTLSTAANALDLLGYFAVSTTYISVFMLAKGT